MVRRGVNCTGKVGYYPSVAYWVLTRLLDKLVSTKEERIRGALKYTWTEGPSMARTNVWFIGIVGCLCSLPLFSNLDLSSLRRSSEMQLHCQSYLGAPYYRMINCIVRRRIEIPWFQIVQM